MNKGKNIANVFIYLLEIMKWKKLGKDHFEQWCKAFVCGRS